jgi:hypothetical protein
VTRFVLASGNRHKLQEFRGILAGHEVLPMPVGVELPPEGVTSFAENALAKARTLAAAEGVGSASPTTPASKSKRSTGGRASSLRATPAAKATTRAMSSSCSASSPS